LYSYLEDEEIEVKCPNNDCCSSIRVRYSDAFNTGQLTCYGCGAQVQLDYTRMSSLRDAVGALQRARDEIERVEQNLSNAKDRLLEGAKMTKKL